MYFEENILLIEKMVALQYSRGYIFGTFVEYFDESSKLVALFQIRGLDCATSCVLGFVSFYGL